LPTALILQIVTLSSLMLKPTSRVGKALLAVVLLRFGVSSIVCTRFTDKRGRQT